MSEKLLEFRANESNCFISDIQHAYLDMCMCTSFSHLLYIGKLSCKSAMQTSLLVLQCYLFVCLFQFYSKCLGSLICILIFYKTMIINVVCQVVDYAIARKIVDLHSNIEETVKSVYSREEVLRYITFARQFKPLICEVMSNCIIY